MPSPSRQYGAALGLAAALLLTACGTTPGETDPPADAGTSTSTTPAPTTTAAPAASSTPSTAAANRPAGLRGLLPTASELPGLDPQWRWQAARTGPAPSAPFGACAKVEMSALGASRAVQRDYRPAAAMGDAADTAAAVQALRFPDRMTAERARRVLVAWHDRCAGELAGSGRSNAKVTSLAPVPSGSSEAWWYLTSWATSGDDGHFQAFGIVVRDDRMVLLTMDHDGQDHSYSPRKDPMYRAVQRVDELFVPQG
ncbi:MAG TPA: hypothetical protein VFK34_04605 [Marmoricola sp.]|jgi:hypothetical protein|nr:hypothetical protein [Marmoricola sp.]